MAFCKCNVWVGRRVFLNPKPKPRESGSGYPTLATLQAYSSSAGLSSTPTLGTSSGFAQNATPPSVGSYGAMPMSACVHATQTSVFLQDLRKVKTTLSTLTFNKSSAFQLVRFWKNGHFTLAFIWVHGIQRHSFIEMRCLKSLRKGERPLLVF
eukprot:4841547-Amphidinium_carterae.4